MLPAAYLKAYAHIGYRTVNRKPAKNTIAPTISNFLPLEIPDLLFNINDIKYVTVPSSNNEKPTNQQTSAEKKQKTEAS